MVRSTISGRWMLGLGLISAMSFVGCGGGKEDTSDAVVVTEPGANIASNAAPAAAPAAAAPAAPAEAAPAAAPVKSEGWGTLKGQVVFGSNAPDISVLVEQGKAPKDPEVCAKDAPIKSDRLVVDGETKGVRYALVFFPKPTAVHDDAKAAAGKAEVLFDQVKCVFEPHVLGVLAGATITLKSSDPVNHNVNAKLQKNTAFNSILAPGQSLPFKPTTGERQPARVTCDIHPWMEAYWMVLDSPYFAVTDEKGNFEIKNAPAGTQKVVVWQEATGFVTAPSGEDVNIAANGETTKSFTIDPSKVKPAK